MRAVSGTHIVRVIASHRGRAGVRRRRAGAAAAALAVPLAAVTFTAAPASAAVRYMVTHEIRLQVEPFGVAADPGTHTAYVPLGTKDVVKVIDEATDRVTHTIHLVVRTGWR